MIKCYKLNKSGLLTARTRNLGLFWEQLNDIIYMTSYIVVVTVKFHINVVPACKAQPPFASICCGFVAQHTVQQAVRQIHKKSK